MEKKNNDNVNHPKHYTFGKYEVIDVIEDWELGYHLGNAVKYIARAGKKNKDKIKEDLEKSIWYIERYISMYGKEMWIDVDEKFLNLEEGDRVRNRLSKSDYIVTKIEFHPRPNPDYSFQIVIVGGTKGEEVKLNRAAEWEKYNGIFPRDFGSGKKKYEWVRIMCWNDIEYGTIVNRRRTTNQDYGYTVINKNSMKFEVELRSRSFFSTPEAPFCISIADMIDDGWEYLKTQ